MERGGGRGSEGERGEGEREEVCICYPSQVTATEYKQSGNGHFPWRIYHHHEGKISPAWCGWRVHALPFSLYLPSRAKLWRTLWLRGQVRTLPLFLLYPYMCSVVTAVPTLSSMKQDEDGGKTVHVVFKYLSRSLLFNGGGLGLGLPPPPPPLPDTTLFPS